MSGLVVPQSGSLETTGDLFEPFRLIDADGVVVAAAGAYFRELAACGRAAATQRSYGMALLRWWRPIWAAGVAWDRRRAELLPVTGGAARGETGRAWRSPGRGTPCRPAPVGPGSTGH